MICENLYSSQLVFGKDSEWNAAFQDHPFIHHRRVRCHQLKEDVSYGNL